MNEQVNVCLNGDTIVVMADGTQKSICDIAAGDMLYQTSGGVCSVCGMDTAKDIVAAWTISKMTMKPQKSLKILSPKQRLNQRIEAIVDIMMREEQS
jgi:L-rhamnose isomerase